MFPHNLLNGLKHSRILDGGTDLQNTHNSSFVVTLKITRVSILKRHVVITSYQKHNCITDCEIATQFFRNVHDLFTIPCQLVVLKASKLRCSNGTTLRR